MTGATHGIGQSRTLWQKNRPDKVIGEAVIELPTTDISLIQLKPDVVFENVPFENNLDVVPHLARIATSEDAGRSVSCYLDSAFSGFMEGVVVASSARIYVLGDTPRYTVYNWMYTSQEEANTDKVQPPDGTCGSVIWNDEGTVLGFYHYYMTGGEWPGYAVSVSASELAEAGYRLAN